VPIVLLPFLLVRTTFPVSLDPLPESLFVGFLGFKLVILSFLALVVDALVLVQPPKGRRLRLAPILLFVFVMLPLVLVLLDHLLVALLEVPLIVVLAVPFVVVCSLFLEFFLSAIPSCVVVVMPRSVALFAERLHLLFFVPTAVLRTFLLGRVVVGSPGHTLRRFFVPVLAFLPFVVFVLPVAPSLVVPRRVHSSAVRRRRRRLLWPVAFVTPAAGMALTFFVVIVLLRQIPHLAELFPLSVVPLGGLLPLRRPFFLLSTIVGGSGNGGGGGSNGRSGGPRRNQVLTLRVRRNRFAVNSFAVVAVLKALPLGYRPQVVGLVVFQLLLFLLLVRRFLLMGRRGVVAVRGWKVAASAAVVVIVVVAAARARARALRVVLFLEDPVHRVRVAQPVVRRVQTLGDRPEVGEVRRRRRGVRGTFLRVRAGDQSRNGLRGGFRGKVISIVVAVFVVDRVHVPIAGRLAEAPGRRRSPVNILSSR